MLLALAFACGVAELGWKDVLRLVVGEGEIKVTSRTQKSASGMYSDSRAEESDNKVGSGRFTAVAGTKMERSRAEGCASRKREPKRALRSRKLVVPKPSSVSSLTMESPSAVVTTMLE